MSNRAFFRWILVLTNVLLIALAIASIALSYLVVTPIVQRDTDADIGRCYSILRLTVELLKIKKSAFEVSFASFFLSLSLALFLTFSHTAILTISMVVWGVLLILFSVCLISIVFSNLICLHLIAALLTCCPLSLAVYLIVRQFLRFDTRNYIVIVLCIVASILWIIQIFVEICLAFNLCCAAGVDTSSTSSLAKLDEEKGDSKDEQDADEERSKKDKKKKKEEKKKKSKKDEKSATDEEKQHLVNENLQSPASNGVAETATTSAASTLEAKHHQAKEEKPQQLQNYNHQQTIEKEHLQQKSSNQQYQMQMLKQHEITHQQTKSSQSHSERKEIQLEEQTVKSNRDDELKKQEFLKQQEMLRIEGERPVVRQAITWT